MQKSNIWCTAALMYWTSTTAAAPDTVCFSVKRSKKMAGAGANSPISPPARRRLSTPGWRKPEKWASPAHRIGGYCAWHLITHYPPEVIGAAAPICGMTDLVVDYLTTRPDLRPLSEEMLSGNPEQAPERYFERSPINFVQNIRGKLLIVQGACDPNVTPENVHQVVKKLGDYHIPLKSWCLRMKGMVF